MTACGFFHSQKGVVLITGLFLLALISIVATTAYIISTSDVSISENYKYEEQAFNYAEAGIQFGLAKLEKALNSGAVLPVSGTMAIPGNTPPSGYSFTLSPLTVKENIFNSYSFSSTGTAPKNASCVIQVGIKRLPVILFGVFGNQKIDSKNNAYYYSYNSRLIPNPKPADSTGNCDVASNGSVSLKLNTFVDGDMVLGNNGTRDAVYNQTGIPIITGEESLSVGRIDPDPLNVDSESFRLEFNAALAVNDNGDISPFLSDAKIVNPVGAVTIPSKSGGSKYYLERIELSNSDVININSENGPISIYLRGSLIAKAGSQINIFNTGPNNDVTIKITEDPLYPISPSEKIVNLNHSTGLNENGLPTGFCIRTDSDGILDFNNISDIKGLVYAPRATVLMRSHSTVYGGIWANYIEGIDGLELYFDTALKDKYLSRQIGLTSWKRVQK